jgi:hypothetical protein
MMALLSVEQRHAFESGAQEMTAVTVTSRLSFTATAGTGTNVVLGWRDCVPSNQSRRALNWQGADSTAPWFSTRIERVTAQSLWREQVHAVSMM